MATRMKLQTFSRKQDFSVQMYTQTDLDIWNSTMGMYQALKVLRTLTNAPWYVSNFTLHKDLQIPFVAEEIKRYSTKTA
jgi:hypothetical protein